MAHLPLSATDTLSAVAGTASAVTYTFVGDNIVGGADSFKVLPQGVLPSIVAGTIWPTLAGQSLVTLKLANVTGLAVTGIKIFANGTAVTNQITGTFTIPANGTAVVTADDLKIFDANGNVVTTSSLTLTGDVTGSGSGSIATTIAGNAVDNTKLTDMAQATFKMRAAAAGTGDPIDGTAAQAKTALAIASTDVSGLGTAAVANVDNATIEISGGNIREKDGGTTNAKLANMGAATVKGSVAGGVPADLTPAQVTTNFVVPDGSTLEVVGNQIREKDAGTTNAKLANVNTATFKGRTTAGTGVPEDLTVAQTQALLGTTGTNTGDVSLANAGSSPNAQAASLAGQVLTLQPASGSFAGNMSAADKTKLDAITGTNTGDQYGSVAQNTVVGRVAAGSGPATALTGTQATTVLDVATTALKGLESAADHKKLGLFFSAEADFGFVGDLVTIFDGAMTSGNATLTCATTTPFTSTAVDGGKRVTVAGAGVNGAQLTTTISTVTDTGHAVLAATAGTTVASKGTSFGTNNTAAITAMQSAVNNSVWPMVYVRFGHAGLTGANPATNAYGYPIQALFNKPVAFIGIGSNTNHDGGDYTKGGGTRHAWWGTSSDGGTAFQAFITVKPAPTGAAAVPTLVRANATTSGGIGGGTASAIGSLPVAPTTGNMLIATVSTGAAVTAPTGWTLLHGPDNSGTVNIYYKVANGEPSSWTWTLATSSPWVVSISEVTGVSTSAVPLVNAASASGTTFATPVVTTVVNGCMIIGVAAGYYTLTGGGTFTPPGSTTLDAQAASSAALSDNVAIAHIHDTTNQTSAGNTTSRTITSSGSASSGEAYTVTLAPGQAAGGQAVSAPQFKDCWLDCRNGDQNQALIGIDAQSVSGFMFDNVFVMDALAIAYYLRVLSPGTAGALSEAKDATRGTLSNLRARMLDLPATGTNALAGATTTSAVTLTASGQTLNIAGGPTLPNAGYVWVATNLGYPVLVNYTGVTGTPVAGTLTSSSITALTGCTVSAQDAINAPATVSGANVVQSVPGNGSCTVLDGDNTANACCATGQTWVFLCGAAVSNVALWGPAAIEFRNSDSWEIYNPIINCAAAVTTPANTNDGAINRIRKPGVRFNGSNTASTQAARNNSLYGGSPGVGGVDAVGVLNTGALLAAPSGPNYWYGQQMGNGEGLPVVENGAVYQSAHNGALQRGGQGVPMVADQTITTALTQVTGSLLWLPVNALQIGTTLEWEVECDQTVTAVANTFTIRGGALGTTADAAIATVAPTATIASATGLVIKFVLTVRTLGAAATAFCTAVGHQSTAAGFFGAQANGYVKATMATFNAPATGLTGPFALSLNFIGGAGASLVFHQSSVKVIHPGPR